MSADLSPLSELASLSIHNANSTTASGSVTPSLNHEGGSNSSSAASSPPSISPIQALTGHPSAPMMHNAQPSTVEGVLTFDEHPELAGKVAAGEHQRRSSGFVRSSNNNAINNNNKLEASDRRTVFIPNLPRETTLREVTNMCAFAEGFIKAQLYDQKSEEHNSVAATATAASGTVTPPNEKVNGRENLTFFGAFILFETAQQAAQVRDRLHGYVFDATVQPPVILQARLAMKNLFLSREDQQQVQSQKSSRRGSHGGFAPQQPQSQQNNNGQHVIPGGDISGNGVYSSATTILVNNMIAHQNGSFSPLLSPQHAGYNIHSGYSPALSPVPMAYGQQMLAPPALGQSNGLNGYYADTGVLSPLGQHAHHQMAPMQQQQQQQQNGVFAGMYPHPGYHHRQHNHMSHAGPYNPPCTTLFIARLDALSNDELYSLLVNSFGETLSGSKFMVDSKGQRIAFVEFDCIDNASVALQRISGYMGLSVAFSKNPLNVRVK